AVVSALHRVRARRTDGMARERQGHRLAAPVVAASGPLLGPGAVSLGRRAVVEEEAWIAFQGREHRAIGEDEAHSVEAAAADAAAVGRLRVEDDEVPAGFGRVVIDVGRMEVAHGAARVPVRYGAYLGADARDVRTASDELHAGPLEERHREVRR